jgi:hypothetical protein
MQRLPYRVRRLTARHRSGRQIFQKSGNVVHEPMPDLAKRVRIERKRLFAWFK